MNDHSTVNVVVPQAKKASEQEIQTSLLLERISLFYFRQLDKTFPDNDPVRSTGTWSRLLYYARHAVQAFDKGMIASADPDWIKDDEKIIEQEVMKFPETVDVKLAALVGRSMVKVVKGEAVITEHVPATLLGEYNAGALGLHYRQYLAQVVTQVMHKGRHSNVIEIGSGSGIVTQSILSEIGDGDCTYTATDMSSAALERLKAKSTQRGGLQFSVLNIDISPEDQGFQPHSYDIVVASYALCSARSLKNALRHIRQLLRPEGIFIMLEVTNLYLARISFINACFPDWWQAEEDFRRYTPVVGKDRYDELLRETGFTGIETSSSEENPTVFPMSLLLSRATERR